MSRKIGQYEIERELGQGGMGTVYLGLDPRLDREVAIKVLKPKLYQEDPEFSARFEQEAKIVASLTHSSIVPIYEYGDDGEWRYFVMPYMRGGSLRDKLDKGAMPLADALPILSRVSAALDKAHSRGIVHRDLKPGNILFDGDGEAYLSDFGIMKLADPTGKKTVQMTSTGIALGTPHYMSPEQLDGVGDLDGRSDIYALGIILYEMLTGKKPYDHESVPRVIAMHYSYPVPNILKANPNLPPAIADAIRTAMAKKRTERYGSARALYAAVQAAAAESDKRPSPKPAPAAKPDPLPDTVETKKPAAIPPKAQPSEQEKKVALLQEKKVALLEDLRAEARQLLAHNLWGDALIVIDRILEIDPNDYSARSLRNQAMLGQKMKQGQQASQPNPISRYDESVPHSKKPSAISWLIVTVVGVVITWAFLFFTNAGVSPVVYGASGFISGSVEWLYLRRHSRRALLWILIKSVVLFASFFVDPGHDGAILLVAIGLFFVLGFIWMYLFRKQ